MDSLVLKWHPVDKEMIEVYHVDKDNKGYVKQSWLVAILHVDSMDGAWPEGMTDKLFIENREVECWLTTEPQYKEVEVKSPRRFKK